MPDSDNPYEPPETPDCQKPEPPSEKRESSIIVETLVVIAIICIILALRLPSIGATPPLGSKIDLVFGIIVGCIVLAHAIYITIRILRRRKRRK